MDKIELKVKLDQLGIDPKQYSLKGELNVDAIILFQNYYEWDVFYFDERGEKNNEKRFNSENDACQYIYKLFNDAKEIERKFRLNT